MFIRFLIHLYDNTRTRRLFILIARRATCRSGWTPQFIRNAIHDVTVNLAFRADTRTTRSLFEDTWPPIEGKPESRSVTAALLAQAEEQSISKRKPMASELPPDKVIPVPRDSTMADFSTKQSEEGEESFP